MIQHQMRQTKIENPGMIAPAVMAEWASTDANTTGLEVFASIRMMSQSLSGHVLAARGNHRDQEAIMSTTTSLENADGP